MTDRYHTLTVVLEKEIRSDDAENLINAIKMIRGVLDVSGNVIDMEGYMAITVARDQMRKQIMDFLWPKLSSER